MSELLESVEAAFSSDYAMFRVGSSDLMIGSMTFASSAAGEISLSCGTQHPRVEVRLERWTAEPPPPDAGWEDRDELPWSSNGASSVSPIPYSAEPREEWALDVADLTEARVQVLAQGRHQYSGNYEADADLPPERWLLRFYPRAGAIDVLEGPPRLVAGPLPFRGADTGWRAAFLAIADAGWRAAVGSLHGFGEILHALEMLQKPSTPDELPTRWGPWGPDRDVFGPHRWDSPLIPENRAIEDPDGDAWEEAQRLILGTAAGMPALNTFDDALQCLLRLGVLVRGGTAVDSPLLPSPAPPAAWDTLAPNDAQRRHWQLMALQYRYAPLTDDIAHLLRWAPPPLTASSRQMAVRLSLSPHDVLGAVRLQVMRGALASDVDLSQATVDTPLRLTPPAPPQRR